MRKARNDNPSPVKRGWQSEIRSSAVEAVKQLERQTLRLPGRPEGELPTVPRNLVKLTNEQLMDLFTELVLWADFSAGQLALAEIDEEAVQTIITRMNAETMVRTAGTATAKRAARDADPEVGKLATELTRVYAYRKLMQVVFGNIERDANLVSRELTRRTSLQPIEQRSTKWKP